MIAYALGERILRGNRTKSGTTPLGATPPSHTGVRALGQRTRERIPRIRDLAQWMCGRSVACHTQTLAALVEGIPGNTCCTHFEGCEVAAGRTNAACARGSNHVWGGLELVWVAVYPSTHLIMEIRQGRRAPNDFWQPASAPGKTETGSRRA